MNRAFDLSTGDFVGAVAAMEPYEFWFAIAFLVLFSLASFLAAFRWFARARLLENVLTSKIRSAAQGYVELEGHAMPAPSRGGQTAPLSCQPCLWWDYKVQERSSNSDGRRGGWRTVDKGTSKVAFLIEDDTGRALVKPAGATGSVNLKRTWYGTTPRPAADPSGIVVAGPGLGRYRYTERLIVAGEQLYAIGQFHTEREDGVHEHILRAPDDGRPFLIATRSQERLTAGLKSSAGSSFAASLAGGAGVIWLLAARGLF